MSEKIIANLDEINLQDFVLVDVRSKADYEREHAEGARWFYMGEGQGLLKLETDPTQPIRAADFEKRMGEIGIKNSDKLLVYDAGTDSRAASRFWYIAKHYGHAEVYILNGGYTQAKLIGVGSKPADFLPCEYMAAVTEGYTYSMPQMLANYKDIVKLDVRSKEEYSGGDLRGNPRGGHMPNAIWLPFDSLINPHPARSFADAEDIIKITQERGIGINDTIATY